MNAKASSTRHSSKNLRRSVSQTRDKTDAKASPTRHSSRSATKSKSQKRRTSSSRSGERSTSRDTRTDRTKMHTSNSEVTRSTESSSSDEDTLSKPKHMLKAPKFDGQTSFETFWAQFMNCVEHNRWRKAQKLVYLGSSLDKDVANVLWDYNKDVTNSLSGLTKVLESRFGGKSFADKHHIELRNRRRRPDESIWNLHVDIRRLATLAFPGVKCQDHEVIACDHFLHALADPDLALKIRERHPSDLDSALQIALQLEVWTADTARLKEATKSDRSDWDGELSNIVSNR